MEPLLDNNSGFTSLLFRGPQGRTCTYTQQPCSSQGGRNCCSFVKHVHTALDVVQSTAPLKGVVAGLLFTHDVTGSVSVGQDINGRSELTGSVFGDSYVDPEVVSLGGSALCRVARSSACRLTRNPGTLQNMRAAAAGRLDSGRKDPH